MSSNIEIVKVMERLSRTVDILRLGNKGGNLGDMTHLISDLDANLLKLKRLLDQ